MISYRDAKIGISDAICAFAKPVTPASFSDGCTRLADGLLVSLELLTLSVAAGLVLGLGLALARGSHLRAIAWPAYAYSYVFRGTPILVQLWIFYFGLGSLGAEGLGPLWPLFREAWWVGLLVLTLNTTAYVGEIFRGAINTLPSGQDEAAKALGLPWCQRMRHVILPQAVRTAWPAYGNEVILLMKASALVSTITVLDLMGQVRTLFSRSYSLEIFLYGAILYLVLAGILTLVLRAVERSLHLPAN